MHKWNKFKLLMWKNWILTKRAPIRTLFEILVPVFMCFLIVGVRSIVESENKRQIVFPPFNPLDAYWPLPKHLAYSPCNDKIDKIMHAIHSNQSVVCFSNEQNLESSITNNDTFLAGIVFDNKYADNRQLEKEKLSVTFRFYATALKGFGYSWETNLLYSKFEAPGPRDLDLDGGNPFYYGHGFLGLQVLFTKALMKEAGFNVSHIPNILMNKYPYPAWNKDLFYSNFMKLAVALIIILSFMYNFINVVKWISVEKENQLKESMKIMGLPGWLHWLAWFLRAFVVAITAVILITLILKLHFKHAPVFKHSNGLIVFLFLALYICTIISFAFLVSVFFSKSNTATAVGGLIYFLSYLPFVLQLDNRELPSTTNRLFWSLLGNSALSYGVSVALQLEAHGTGVQWYNMNKRPTADDSLTFIMIWIMFLIDITIYLLLAFYVEAIFPGDFGVAQKWYFPFTFSYWFGNKKTAIVDADQQYDGPRVKNEFIEETDETRAVGIQLKDLTKIFGKNQAVNKINLDMFEGQITVLLGHNGAGKTTTMSMITGMIPPTSGTVIVGNYDIRVNLQRARDSMGFCLQHNVLFDNLTVEEHIKFFAKLKGLSGNLVKKEIDLYIGLLNFEDKRKAFASSLSGGMKRKLSVAISLCGQSKVVILDEPTAGMDPSARRCVWELLQHEKKDRTILLTTHFMDEADLLGDRIAIMSCGNLQCVGTGFFLKKKYGASYKLTMDVQPTCNPNDVTKLLEKHIPEIKVKSFIGSELSYMLLENDAYKFEAMLKELEDNCKKLQINSYGISLTSLEEVFMKAGAKKELPDPDIENRNNKKLDNDYKTRKKYLKGSKLLLNQICAILLKKYKTTLRAWIMFLIQILIPVLLIVLVILRSRSQQPPIMFPPRAITLDHYLNPVTLVSGDKTSKYYNYYRNMKINGKIREVTDLKNTILDLIKQDAADVKSHYIVGANIANDSLLVAWFNGEPFHSTALSLQLLLNIVLRDAKHLPEIELINHPLPLSQLAQARALKYNFSGFQLGLQLGFSLAFVASFYIIFCIRDRVSKSKHLQFVSGMRILIYWGISFAWDYINYVFITLGIFVTILSLNEEGFRTVSELARLFLLLLCFGLFVIPFVYLTSYLYLVPATGFSRILLFGAITCTAGLIIIGVLENPQLDLIDIAKSLHWILLFSPFYPAPKGIIDISSMYNDIRVCKEMKAEMSSSESCLLEPKCCNWENSNYLSLKSPGVGRNILISVIMSIFLFIILLLIDYKFFTKLVASCYKTIKLPTQTEIEDDDITEEVNKIRNTQRNDLLENYTLVLHNVTKYYGKFRAVNGVYLAVKPFECFGLLGVNGAGKTSTFKMVTGDEPMSFGNAWINGINVTRKLRQVRKFIGYCPQFDALLDDLTSRETLLMFALIRGVPRKECNLLAESLATQFDFMRDLDKLTKHLSGGNKRKLSTAIAVIGDPPLIFLDEPTTGMDPAAKRFLWQQMCKLRDSGKTIVLTSHSMEECEALCTRLAIMVDGNFKCLGSTQRLKNKFAQGYTLIIKLKKDGYNLEKGVAQIESFIREHFPRSKLKEAHEQLLNYNIFAHGMPWSEMFGIMENNKNKLHIEDYSLGQCSLEQVFLSFTQDQKNGKK